MEGVLLMKQLEIIIVHVMLVGQEKHVTLVRYIVSLLNVLITFTDINECLAGTKLCHDLAECVNTAGSYKCQCQSGYEFDTDGFTCVGKIKNYFYNYCHFNFKRRK